MNNTLLKGITVLELNGLAPVQFCGQILSNFGARVIRIDKAGPLPPSEEFLGNGKLSVAMNLKSSEGIDALKRLSSASDVIMEPFRAGVMEKLGLGPDVLLKNNKRLIYVRLSGYGQKGALSKLAGHDINFLSLSGVLSFLGWRNNAPEPPCNLVGDFAGGSLLCALGIVMALYEREKSGLGQVIDSSIMRGSSFIASWIYGTKQFIWTEPRGNNLLDGGSYMYDVYETRDGRWMAVGALEKKFYDQLLVGLSLTEEQCPYYCSHGREIFTEKFKQKTQEEWIQIFSKLDACVTPVLSVEEAVSHRPEDFIKIHDVGNPMPMPEPRFSRSEPVLSATTPPPSHGEHTAMILRELGYRDEEIRSLAASGAIFVPDKQACSFVCMTPWL